MREIKFRVYNERDNKFEIIGINQLVMSGNSKIQQFTGLYDRNKKPIYEGDILKNIGEVKNFGYFFRFGKYTDLKTDGNWAFSNEIIGNIYENPELLK